MVVLNVRNVGRFWRLVVIRNMMGSRIVQFRVIVFCLGLKGLEEVGPNLINIRFFVYYYGNIK